MEMQGSRRLPATVEQAWDALNDPETLKLCIPGCDRFESTGPQEYTVGMALKVGPVAAKFGGKVAISDMQPPHSYRLSFEGQGGVAGFGKGSSAVSLAAVSDGDPATACELSYTVQAQVGGKIAQLGQRLVDGAAKSIADDFFKRFEAELQRRHAPADAIESISKDVDGTGAKTTFMQKIGLDFGPGKSGQG